MTEKKPLCTLNTFVLYEKKLFYLHKGHKLPEEYLYFTFWYAYWVREPFFTLYLDMLIPLGIKKILLEELQGDKLLPTKLPQNSPLKIFR